MVMPRLPRCRVGHHNRPTAGEALDQVADIRLLDMLHHLLTPNQIDIAIDRHDPDVVEVYREDLGIEVVDRAIHGHRGHASLEEILCSVALSAAQVHHA